MFYHNCFRKRCDMGNRAKIREEAKKLNPIDDLMFRKMAEDKEFCEEILRVMLEDRDLSVLEAVPQWSGTNLQGRSVILDAKCVKGDGTQVDVEVQNADDDDHQRRVRYNGAILTTNVADPGSKFKNVPDVCVVFISRFDIFHGGRPLYHIDRVVRETGQTVRNGFEEVYVNAAVRDGSEVSALMEVFVNSSAYDARFPKTSSSKRRYKETEGGLDTMCEIMEKLRSEARTEGRKEGRREGSLATLSALVRDGVLTLPQAARMAEMAEDVFAENMKNFSE